MCHSARRGTWASYLRGAEAAPCVQISQLEVCQLLATSPQVIYPIGLNGQDKPIITSLPEPLASSISLPTGKPIYLGIDIPSPPMEEPDQKIPPLGEVSTIIVASPHKSPPKLEGSLSRGHSHQHLPNCHHFQDWKHYSPGGCNGAPGKCQQSP